MNRRQLTVPADHFQFYMEDERSSADTSTIWDNQRSSDRLATGPGLIAVGTARYGGWVRVEFELRDTPPVETLDQWDHVVGCSVQLPTGRILFRAPVVSGMEQEPIEIAPGSYQARVCYAGLDTVSDEEAETGDDYYRIVLWPGVGIETTVLKRSP